MKEKTLFDMWTKNNLKEAQEDIEIRNETYGWNIPLPKTKEEAIEVYKDKRVIDYVLSECKDRIESFSGMDHGVEYYEKELLIVTNEKEIDFTKKRIKEYQKLIKSLSNIVNFIETKL